MQEDRQTEGPRQTTTPLAATPAYRTQTINTRPDPAPSSPHAHLPICPFCPSAHLLIPLSPILPLCVSFSLPSVQFGVLQAHQIIHSLCLLLIMIHCFDSLIIDAACFTFVH